MISTFLEVDNLTLDIPVFNVSRSFRTTLLSRVTGGRIEQNDKSKQVSIRALDNISFRLEAGDRLGLVGHNGAGKTTLLRVLARIYKPMIGRYQYKGKITSLFNMSVGLDLDDTGVDNIYTIGMHLGMTKSEIETKKDEIIEFSELGDFIYLPVRIYSAGMQMRLSFAIATAVEPDILLMDEGIGAGDANFAEKAKNRLTNFYDKTSVMVIASHSADLISQLCNKALLLEHGRQMKLGSVEEIFSQYYSMQI
jgi:ABC-type polysaccharide/polyol phosphate transport system ATPase subunit